MDATGVLPAFTGAAWASYDCYPTATRALCNAHLLWEWVAVAETAPEGAWCWVEQVHNALLELKAWSLRRSWQVRPASIWGAVARPNRTHPLGRADRAQHHPSAA